MHACLPPPSFSLFLSQVYVIQKEVKAHVKEAAEFALGSEFPSAKELYTHVFTEADTVTRGYTLSPVAIHCHLWLYTLHTDRVRVRWHQCCGQCGVVLHSC